MRLRIMPELMNDMMNQSNMVIIEPMIQDLHKQDR